MAIITLDDVRKDNPKLRVTPASPPTEDDVTYMIGEIQSECQAQLEACGFAWPADNSPAAAYLKRTVLEGTRWLVLRAMFTFSTSAAQSQDIDRAYQAYKDRLGQICDIARAAQNVQDTKAGQTPFRRAPQVAMTDYQPNLSSSFQDWTQAVDISDQIRTARRWTGLRPWPLIGGEL